MTDSEAVVVLYEHKNYGGWGVKLKPGVYCKADLMGMKDYRNNGKSYKNDAVSSIKILEPGSRVDIYEHDNYGGYHTQITKDTINTKNLRKIRTGKISPFVKGPNNFNDMITSVIVNSSTTNFTKDDATKCLNWKGYPISRDGKCGPNNGNKACSKTECCSENGLCGGNSGTSSAYCYIDNHGYNKGEYDGVKPSPFPPRYSTFPKDNVPYTEQTNPFDKDNCSIYYTSVTGDTNYDRNLREYCDKGLFSMSKNQLKLNYGNEIANVITKEAKNLPEPTVCKAELPDWKRASNAPLFIARDPTNVNRGPQSDWAFCFKEINNTTDFDTLKNKFPLTTNSNVATFKLYNELLTPGSQYGFDDSKKYARVTVNFANADVNYNTIRSDICKTIDYKLDPKIPQKLFGITVESTQRNVSPADVSNPADIKIKDIGIYKIAQNGRSIEKDSNTTTKFKMFSALFEEKAWNNKIYINPRTVNATTYVLGKDICNNIRLTATSSGTFNLVDFGVRNKEIHRFSKQDTYYNGETSSELVKKLADYQNKQTILLNEKTTLEKEKTTLQDNYNKETNNSVKNTIKSQMKNTDDMIRTKQRMIADNNKIIRRMNSDIKNINNTLENHIKGVMNSRDIIGKRLHNGLPPSLITRMDNRIYFTFS